MPDRHALQVGDHIRLTRVPASDLAQREREILDHVESGWTANTLERIIALNPIVTISHIDEHGDPWFEVQLVGENNEIEYHSLNITDNDSWTLRNQFASDRTAIPNPYRPPDTSAPCKRPSYRARYGFFSFCVLIHFAIATNDILHASNDWTRETKLMHFAQVISGPIDLHRRFRDPSEILLAIALFIAIIAHPVRPSSATAVITGIGFATWIIFGLAIAYIGV